MTARPWLAGLMVCALAFESLPAAAGRIEELQRKLDRGQSLTDAELAELLDAMPAEEVDVDLIMVPVLVTSRWGRPVTGLRAQDFRLEVGGRKLPLQFFNADQALPLRLCVLLDVSGSMAQPEQRDRLRETLVSVLATLARGDQMQLMTFASAEVRTHRPWTEEVSELASFAISLPPAGETAIVDALREASRLMPEPERSRPAVLLITDGLDNSSTGTIDQAIDAARAVGTPIYAFGLGGLDRVIQDRIDGQSPWDPLRRVAEETGGSFFEVERLEQAQAAAAQLNRELRSQYWLAFRPLDPPDGRFRPITVSVARSGARVRARSGYR